MRKVREKMASFDVMPESARDALARWDKGWNVFTIEMGGLGPGYEQCIHIAVFELIRDHVDDGKFPTERDEKWGDMTLDRVNDQLGLSGAQAGAAKHLAYRYLQNGWKKTVEEVDSDRRIQVNKEFPHLEENIQKAGCGCHG